MSRTDGHGETGYDGDPDVFVPKKVGLSRRKSLFLVAVDVDSGTVRITAAHTVTEVSEHDLVSVIESLEEAREFLASHTHRTS